MRPPPCIAGWSDKEGGGGAGLVGHGTLVTHSDANAASAIKTASTRVDLDTQEDGVGGVYAPRPASSEAWVQRGWPVAACQEAGSAAADLRLPDSQTETGRSLAASAALPTACRCRRQPQTLLLNLDAPPQLQRPPDLAATHIERGCVSDVRSTTQGLRRITNAGTTVPGGNNELKALRGVQKPATGRLREVSVDEI